MTTVIKETVIKETFAALKAANIEDVIVSFSDDCNGYELDGWSSGIIDWIKFSFNEQGVKDLKQSKRKNIFIRENLKINDWNLEIEQEQFEGANIINLKCTKELWNILVSFVRKEYETSDVTGKGGGKAGGYVIWKENSIILDACENVKLRNSDSLEKITLFADGKYVRQYGTPEVSDDASWAAVEAVTAAQKADAAFVLSYVAHKSAMDAVMPNFHTIDALKTAAAWLDAKAKVAAAWVAVDAAYAKINPNTK